jgi:hypothetical protein
MAKKTGKRKGKGQGAKKRKARIADLEKDIFTANKRAHFQSKRDDELFVIDNKPGKSAVGGRAKSIAKNKSNSTEIPNVDVPVMFESAPTRAVMPGIAKNLRNQLHSSKRVGGDRHLQSATQTKDEDLYDAWGSSSKSASSSGGLTDDFDSPRLYYATKPAVYHNKRMASSKSRLTAADVVPEGASYNPEARAHAKLVLEAKAEKLMRKQKLAHTVAALQPPIPPTDPSLLDSDNEDEETEQDSLSSSSSSSLSTAVSRKAPKKLTKAQRNAQARVKAEKELAAKTRSKKTLNSQLAHLKELNNTLTVEEKYLSEKKTRVEEWRKESELQPQPLKYGGKISKNQPKVAVVAANKLSRNMRNLQTVGNPVLDRMHNMLRRNLVEQGKKVRMKKPKQKKLERNRGWKLDVPESDDEEE